MSTLDELHALSRAKPPILDRPDDVMGRDDEDRILEQVLRSAPVAVNARRSPISLSAPGPRRVLTLAAVVALLVGGIAFALRPAGARTPAAWHVVSDLTSSSWGEVSALGLSASISLACPSPSTCYADVPSAEQPRGSAGAFDAVEVTSDSGATWEQADLSQTVTSGSEISCWSPTECAQLAFSTDGSPVLLATSDGGQTWRTSAGPGSLSESFGEVDLSCAGAATCVAVASDPGDPTTPIVSFSTTDRGATWRASTVGVDFATGSLRCLSTSACVLVGHTLTGGGEGGLPGGTAYYTTDTGATWQQASVPPGSDQLGALSCDGSRCTVGALSATGSGTDLLTSSDEGRTWSALSSPGLDATLVTGLSCSASNCWLSGLLGASIVQDATGLPSIDLGQDPSGTVASSTDGGQTWQPASLPDGVLMVSDLTCPSATSCFALGLLGTTSGSVRFGLLSDDASGLGNDLG